MIANDRRRSQRELFPYNPRRSQMIAEPTVAIHFVQRKCHMYSRVVLAGKSKQTTWRTSKRKFCCKQIYLTFCDLRSAIVCDHMETRFCDRLRSCDRDRRRSQKIELCSIFCDRLRSSAIVCDPAIIWKPKFCDLRSKCIP